MPLQKQKHRNVFPAFTMQPCKKTKQLVKQTKPTSATAGDISCHQPPVHQEAQRNLETQPVNSFFKGPLAPGRVFERTSAAHQNQLGCIYTPSCLLGGSLPVTATARSLRDILLSDIFLRTTPHITTTPTPAACSAGHGRNQFLEDYRTRPKLYLFK